jgi:hypothetical protein
MTSFNELTPAEAERLAYLTEEMAEAIQIIGKILRHGYESRDPTKARPTFDDNRGGQTGFINTSPTNRRLLEAELGDVTRAIRMLIDAGDLDRATLDRLGARAAPQQYMHHQRDAIVHGVGIMRVTGDGAANVPLSEFVEPVSK